MKLNSLLEYLLTEKIRSKNFNMREFKSLTDFKDASVYARERLEQIGEGSSRLVFILSSSKVLKLVNIDADPSGHYDENDQWVENLEGSMKKGVWQNEAEFATYTNSHNSLLLPKIYDHHPKFYWLISELVKPLKWNDWTTFEKTSGVSKEDLNEFRYSMSDNDGTGTGDREDYEDSPFLVALFDLISDQGIDPNDLQSGDQWGVTVDGKLVLLDSGGTIDVLESLYETE